VTKSSFAMTNDSVGEYQETVYSLFLIDPSVSGEKNLNDILPIRSHFQM